MIGSRAEANGRGRRTALLLLSLLAALAALRADASRTSVWESNPHAAVFAKTDATGQLAPLAPARPLESILADAEPVGPLRIDLGPLELLGPAPLRGPPPSYPETRVGGFELLPPFRVGASPRLSLWSRQACGFPCLGLASDGPEDPWGLKTFVNPTIGPDDVVGQVNLETGNSIVDFWILSPVNNTLNTLGGLLNTGPNAVFGALRALGWTDTDIEALNLFMVTNPVQVQAALAALRSGTAQASVQVQKLLERLRAARAEAIAAGGMRHPERGVWVPGGVRRQPRGFESVKVMSPRDTRTALQARGVLGKADWAYALHEHHLYPKWLLGAGEQETLTTRGLQHISELEPELLAFVKSRIPAITQKSGAQVEQLLRTGRVSQAQITETLVEFYKGKFPAVEEGAIRTALEAAVSP